MEKVQRKNPKKVMVAIMAVLLLCGMMLLASGEAKAAGPIAKMNGET